MGKFFKHYQLVAVNQPATDLVGEIRTMVRYPLMDFGKNSLLLGVMGPVLHVLHRIFPLLDTLEVGFVTAQETRVIELLTIRQGSKGGLSDIHIDYLTGGVQGFG